MDVTLTLDDELVEKVSKIAATRDTTLDALVRQHLEELAAADVAQKKRNLEALERSFEQVQLKMGKRTWTRADLYER